MKIIDSLYKGIPHVFCYDSGVSGPTICLMCCVHGNEKQGEVLLQRFYEEYQSLVLCGRMFYVVANMEAYLEDKRLIQYDFNRIRTKDIDQNSYEYLRRNQLASIFDECDVLLDFHTTSQNHTNLGVIDMSYIQDSDFFDTNMILVDDSISTGSTISYFASCDKRGYGMEIGTHNCADIDSGIHTILSLLSQYGMIETVITPAQSKIFLRIVQDIVPLSDSFVFCEYIDQTGFSVVGAGQVYAYDGVNQYTNTTNRDLYVGLVSIAFESWVSAGLLFEELNFK